jgi:hypothetical protein
MGPKVSRLVQGNKSEPKGPAAKVSKWFRRGKAFGEAIWKSRR